MRRRPFSWGWRLLLLLALIVIGLYTKFHRGWNQEWVNHSLGGVFYVMFWCGFWDLISSRRSALIISVSVVVVTFGLEFLQLSQHPMLEWFRQFFVGRTLIGTTFAADDFLYYSVGGLLGYAWVRVVRGGGT